MAWSFMSCSGGTSIRLGTVENYYCSTFLSFRVLSREEGETGRREFVSTLTVLIAVVIMYLKHA